MNTEELKRLAEAANKAYGGLPWQVTMARHDGVTHYHIRGHCEPAIAVVKAEYWEDDYVPPVDDYGYNQPDERMDCDPGRVDIARHIAAANPATVLGLIAEIERLREQKAFGYMSAENKDSHPDGVYVKREPWETQTNIPLYAEPVPAPAVPYGVDEEAANRIALAVYDCKNGIKAEPLLHAINHILMKEIHPLSQEGLAQMQPIHQPVGNPDTLTPHKGATHCDDCGLTWLDDGLNPLGCPYCKDHVPAPAVPEELLKCWLIESPASSDWPAIWLTITTDGRRWVSDGGTMYATGGDWYFTSAASEALKFAEKESADEYVRHNKIKDVVVTEHIFDNRALLQSAEVTK